MSETPAELPVVCLMGPTASGKTALAMALVQRLPLDIISVDSAMVYRGMDIGTGKPGPAELARAPHRLIDIRDAHESYSAAEFRRDALAEIAAVRARGRIPLLVGGTGLYFRALRRGLARLPAADAATRARLAEDARRHGWAALHRRLALVDAESAARIHPNDPQRIQRALEVFEITGQPMSRLLGCAGSGRLAGPTITVVIEPDDRTGLHRHIERRFHGMLERGLVEEVTALLDDPRIGPDVPSMRAVGYRQVCAHLAGALDHESMVSHAVAATRQLARRQLTWLRAERDALRLSSQAADLVGRAGEVLARALDP